MTSSVAGLREAPSTSQSQCSCPQNGHECSLIALCWFNSLQLSESGPSLHLEVHLAADQWDAPKLQYSAVHWSTERAQFFSTTMPDHHMFFNQCFKKVEQIELWSLPHSPYSSLSSANTTSNLDNFFCGKMLLQPAGGWKCFSRVHWILKHEFLHYRNKQTYFPTGKNMLIN